MEQLEETTEASSAANEVRGLIDGAKKRGAPVVSSYALQTGLFEIYDAVSHNEDALALIQDRLSLTLHREFFSFVQIEEIADQLEWFLALSPSEVLAG